MATEERIEGGPVVMPGGLVPTPPGSGGMGDVEVARAVAQVQGSMIMAKKYPRDEVAAITRIKQSAQRRRLAEQSAYEYKRGGSQIAGPSIRAAEALSLAWGNCESGWLELYRDLGKAESLVMAYSVDLETNVWKRITFTVPHTRDTREGSKPLKDARDIYERIANDASRRLRACILANIPADVVDTYMEECDKTLSSDPEPLQKRIGAMVEAMKAVDVTQPMLEAFTGGHIGAITERQLTQLRRIYQALKDGFASPTDYFKPKVMVTTGQAADLNARIKAQGQMPKTDAPKEEPQPSDPEAFPNFK